MPLSFRHERRTNVTEAVITNAVPTFQNGHTAFTIASLENAALGGHTLLPKAKAVDAILSRRFGPHVR